MNSTLSNNSLLRLLNTTALFRDGIKQVFPSDTTPLTYAIIALVVVIAAAIAGRCLDIRPRTLCQKIFLPAAVACCALTMV